MNVQELYSNARSRLVVAGRALLLVHEAAGMWTLGWASALVVQGLIPAALVYLTKVLVDSVAAAVNAGVSWESVQVVLIPAVLVGILMVLQQGLGSVVQWVSTAQSELLQDHIKGLIHEKAAAVHYSFYESSDYYDLLQQANSGASGRTLALLENIGSLVRSTISLLSIAVLLVGYSPLVPLLLLLSTLPALYVVIRHNRFMHAWWERNTEVKRRAQYYDSLMTLHLTAAEVRLLNIGEKLHRTYQTLRERLRTERLDLVRKQATASLTAGLAALVVTAGTMVWMMGRAMRGAATLGDLALFYQAFNQGQSLMRTLLSGAGEIYTNTLFLDHLFSFLEQPETDVHLDSAGETQPFPVPLRQGVAFRDVTFTYPGTTRPVLENFNFEIPAGQIAAIVGPNGAGKSTIIKLLCRLHEVDGGRIEVDGSDIRSFDVDDLRRHISVMFQHPVKYQEKAWKNIARGHEEESRKAIEDAARQAGAHDFISKLPQAYDTQLGRMFTGGLELSGGEWQRIALARAFLRDSPIVVLDEPTSFMDPWAENEWIQRFRRLVDDRTALLITHRFTTARMADVIYVLEDGCVVEQGSHEELVAQNGLYATSWAAQQQRGRSMLNEEVDQNGEVTDFTL